MKVYKITWTEEFMWGTERVEKYFTTYEKAYAYLEKNHPEQLNNPWIEHPVKEYEVEE